MKFLKKLLIAVMLQVALMASTGAQQASKEQIKGLDEQVQDIKKDVLAISSELMQLEEKLLYPSNTQVSVFVSLTQPSKLRLDSVSIKVDGKDAAHHIYTFKEQEALQKGGVQRIHTGNVRTGEHALEVSVTWRNSSNAAQQHTTNYKFTKAVEPKLVEIVLNGSDAQAILFKE